MNKLGHEIIITIFWRIFYRKEEQPSFDTSFLSVSNSDPANRRGGLLLVKLIEDV